MRYIKMIRLNSWLFSCRIRGGRVVLTGRKPQSRWFEGTDARSSYIDFGAFYLTEARKCG